MEWFGASVIAPRENATLEFEIAGERTVRIGSYRDATFFGERDAIGYPRRLVRRWRYVSRADAVGGRRSSDSEDDVAIVADLACE